MFHIHIYKTVYGIDDIAVYQECRCGKRRYVQYGQNVTKPNVDWLGRIETSNGPKEPPLDPFNIYNRN